LPLEAAPPARANDTRITWSRCEEIAWSIQQGVHFSPSVEWVVNAYTLVFGGFLLADEDPAEEAALAA
jgi:hypothetical protein